MQRIRQSGGKQIASRASSPLCLIRRIKMTTHVVPYNLYCTRNSICSLRVQIKELYYPTTILCALRISALITVTAGKWPKKKSNAVYLLKFRVRGGQVVYEESQSVYNG